MSLCINHTPGQTPCPFRSSWPKQKELDGVFVQFLFHFALFGLFSFSFLIVLLLDLHFDFVVLV